MAGITLADAEAKLAYWMNIEGALGANLSVTIEGKTFTRHNLEQIRSQAEYWNRWVQRLSRTGGLTVREVIPR